MRKKANIVVTGYGDTMTDEEWIMLGGKILFFRLPFLVTYSDVQKGIVLLIGDVEWCKRRNLSLSKQSGKINVFLYCYIYCR
jgi:hypothetical protein